MSGPVHVEAVPAVVVGAGVAGLAAALELAAAASGDGRSRGRGPDVVVVTDEAPGLGGSSPWAQGGMAAAVGADDRPEDHAADTVAAGAGLVDARVARLIVDAAPDVVAWLERAGARFDRRPDGALALGREAAHGRARIVHAKDATGAELVRTLTAAATATPGVELATGLVALDLIRADGRVAGLLTRRRVDGQLVAWVAPAVVLATGGYAHLWATTTTPPQTVGDGIAMAARAGAALADLEFVQFHPTALAAGRDPAPLLTEALRGEGAVLVDEAGERFALAAHPDGELAPRDVVARAIYAHLAAGHRVYLDARRAVGERFPERFPTVFAHCTQVGIDPRVDPVPVSPAAHYCMGGVVTDASGRTSVPGLWAAGEVTATGLHGANRLASNSLLEGIVMGRRAAADVVAAGRGGTRGPQHAQLGVSPAAFGWCEDDPHGVVASVRGVLWTGAGVVRDATGLARAAAELDSLAPLAAGSRPGENALLVARLVVEAAMARRESRGAHHRADFPTAPTGGALRRPVRLPEASTVALAELEVAAA